MQYHPACGLPKPVSTYTYACLLCGDRFEKGRIYTYIGDVVVSVNPYKEMDIYGKDAIDAYRGRELYENPPHLYAVSDAAYKVMKRRAKDTCIVISGQFRNEINTPSHLLTEELICQETNHSAVLAPGVVCKFIPQMGLN